MRLPAGDIARPTISKTLRVMMDRTYDHDFPVTTPEFEDELRLDWKEPPTLIVLRHPEDQHLTLVNIGRRTLDITRARDASVVLLSPDGDSIVAEHGGFTSLGVETRLQPGDSTDVIARTRFGHDGSSRGFPSSGNYLVVVRLRVGIRQENDWKYDGGMVVSRPVQIKLRVFPERDQNP